MKKRITLLCLALALSLAGCGGAPRLQARDLMAEVPAPKIPVAAPMTEEAAAAAMDFCVQLFQASGAGEGENVLLSPLSVLLALGTTANGAGGETLAQMEEAFGLPLLALNEFCHAWLASREEDGPLQAANSLWLRDSGELTVEEDFLEANALWYGADVYEAPFDSATLADINAWVDHHTGGMIPSLLEEIPDSAMVYLINALSFDSRWETIYREDQVHTGTFTREDGQERQVELMHSEESYFLFDGEAQGFLKPYQGGRYAFAALLPPEGMSLADYVASLEGGRLAQVLSGAREEAVWTAIPQFTMAYRAELSQALEELGITDAFDPFAADFSAMGRSEAGPLFISQVLHRTFLAVDAAGTRAGAATAVTMDAGADAPVTREVILDRPFLCLLLDGETGLPLLMGAVTDVGQQ